MMATRALGCALVCLLALAGLVLTWVVLVMAAQAVGWRGLALAPYAVWMSLATSLAVWFALNVP